MPKKLPLQRALAVSLGRLEKPVITAYELGVLIYGFYVRKAFSDQELALSKSEPTAREYSSATGNLLASAVLEVARDFPHESVFEILGRSTAPAAEIACAVDPFCYVSHINAMAFHGITDRMPRTLHLSSPPPNAWTKFAGERMQKDLGHYFERFADRGFPRLTRIQFTKIRGQQVERHHSSHLGAYRSIQGKSLRVATIGRTFLDMLRDPEYCGGINHVLDVFQRSAKQNLRLIVTELDTHGRPIDKVRAGYIVMERCGLRDPTVESWVKYAQRGGSRKLDPNSEYSPDFSERWCLSLNVPQPREAS